MAGAVAAFAFAMFFAVAWGVASARTRRRRGYGMGYGLPGPARELAAPMGVEAAREVAAAPTPSPAQLEAAAQALDAGGAPAEAEEARDRAAAAAAAEELLRRADAPYTPPAPEAGPAPPAEAPAEAPPAEAPPAPAPSRPPSEAGPATAEDFAALMRREAEIAVPGYNPTIARALAPELDRELRRLGTGDRNTRSRRQTGATLTAIEQFARAAFGDAYADGQRARTVTRATPQGYVPYGGGLRGALVYYGIANPPAPLVAPLATLPYSPPEGPAAAASAGGRRRRR